MYSSKNILMRTRVRNGRGREGSKMRAFYTVWKLVGDQYVDGERSTAEELSWFFWPRMRGSMQGERYNRWKNDLSKYKTQGAKASLNSWLETSRLEESFSEIAHTSFCVASLGKWRKTNKLKRIICASLWLRRFWTAKSPRTVTWTEWLKSWAITMIKNLSF